MRVAQVTARLAETIVDVAYVAPGERYAIGTARDVQLAIAGVREFQLVTHEPRGFVVRRPVGLGTLSIDGKACDDTELVLSWARVTLRIGLVTIAIELVERSAVPLPRRELERRTPAFVVASLIVHLLVWGSAIAFGHLPRAKKPRPIKQAHPLVVHLAPLPVAPPTPPTATPPAHPAVAIARPPAAGARDHAAVQLSRDADGNASPAAAMAALNAVMPDGYITQMLDEVGPVYVPSAVDHPFGDNVKMDPKTRPGWGALTIVTGRYRTISSGPNAGGGEAPKEDPLPASQGLALCESRRCEISGGLAKEAVQEVAATRGYALEKCVQRGAVLLELDIAADGTVKKVRGEGAAARCAATVIASLAFPAADEATHATFTIGYP